jgi:hypothetical protein
MTSTEREIKLRGELLKLTTRQHPEDLPRTLEIREELARIDAERELAEYWNWD